MSETNEGTTALGVAEPDDSQAKPEGDTPVADPKAKPEGDAAGDTPKGEGEGEAKGEGDAKEGEEGKGEKPAGPPEVYEFKTPEGVTLSDADREQLSALCKELGLSQESAQTLLDKQLERQRAAVEEATAEVDTLQQSWKEAQAADKEYGGKALQENIGTAVKALSKFGTPELVQLLNDSRLGDHPEVIRVFYRIGKALAEDKFNAPAGESGGQRNVAERLYPNLAVAS